MGLKPNQAGEMSNADIAATLFTAKPTPVVEEAVDVDAQVDIDAGEDEDDLDQSPTGGDDLEEDQDDQDDQDETDDATQEGDEPSYLDISDDDLITVMVDGEEQEVSIGQLKKAHSGEGAIERRLQQATEVRNAAVAQQTQALEILAAQEQILLTALDTFDDTLFAPVIPKPSEALKTSNPQRYLQHKEAYDQDQARIKKARDTVKEAKETAEKQRTERLQSYAKQASEIISREIPELVSKDPTIAQKTYATMANTAKAYGYTEQEISAALDPRMFLLVRDAAKYRELVEKTKGRNVKDLTAQEGKKVRRLRSGNTQAASRARQSDQKRKAVAEKARTTGKVADIAATLLKPKR